MLIYKLFAHKIFINKTHLPHSHIYKKVFFILYNLILKLFFNFFISSIINEIKLKMHIFKYFKSNPLYHISYFDFINNKISINYILKFVIYKKNIMLHLTDIKGTTLLYINSGLLNILKNQKINKHTILKTLSIVLENVHFSKNSQIALHFNSNLKNFNKLIIKYLKSTYKINVIKLFNLTPHNGCRPKKLKRLKRFSLSNIKFKEEMTEWLKVIDCKSIGVFLP